MDKLGVITSFLHNIVVYNIPLLYGTVGEIVVEKSGSLNLGVEGIMAVVLFLATSLAAMPTPWAWAFWWRLLPVRCAACCLRR